MEWKREDGNDQESPLNEEFQHNFFSHNFKFVFYNFLRLFLLHFERRTELDKFLIVRDFLLRNKCLPALNLDRGIREVG